MKRALAGLASLATLASTVAAPQNPFRPSSGSVKSALVQYALTGDENGSEELVFTADRRATRTNSTTRVFGRDTKANRLEIDTRDSSYRVDLDKKEGYRTASPTAVMADEYDKLSASEKERFQSNMRELASVFTQAFGAGSLSGVAEVRGREMVAGQACEVHQLGNFTVCTLLGAPEVPLRLQGELFCLRVNKVASTATLNAAVPPERFALPADIKWKSADHDAMSAADARRFVRQMASQEVSDSLAKAREQVKAAQDSARARAQAGGTQPSDSLSAAQREQMCKTMREGIQLHVQLAPPNPGKMVQQGVTARVSSAQAMAQALLAGAADTAKARAKEGLMKKLKPKFP
jgi:hypothetical protein